MEKSKANKPGICRIKPHSFQTFHMLFSSLSLLCKNKKVFLFQVFAFSLTSLIQPNVSHFESCWMKEMQYISITVGLISLPNLLVCVKLWWEHWMKLIKLDIFGWADHIRIISLDDKTNLKNGLCWSLLYSNINATKSQSWWMTTLWKHSKWETNRVHFQIRFINSTIWEQAM